MKSFTDFINQNIQKVLFVLVSIISIGAFLYFYLHGQQNLGDYDAIARLNIARKIVDSLTPGVGQLGGIWLPFPQVLMLPFVWNDFLWRSGISGAIISMISFIVGAVFIFKTTLLLTHSKFASLITWLVYVTNINILFLQTMAMSESLFLTGIILVIYFIIKWITTRNLIFLIYSAFFITVVTLTRYEGYFIFISAFICVLICSYYMFKGKSDKFKHIEGIFVLFITLASLGILIWMIYSLLFYKDPFYWLNLYSGKAQLIPGSSIQPVEDIESTVVKPTRDLIKSAQTYTWAMALMNGVIVTALGFIGFLYLIIKNAVLFKRNKLDLKLIPLAIISIFLILFLIIGYYIGMIPSIQVPTFSFSTLTSKASNLVSSSNIRYGIIVLPLLAILIGYLSSLKKVLKFLILFLIVFQVFVYFFTPLFLTFQLQAKSTYNVSKSAVWFKENYDGGLILISAHRYEPFMLSSGQPYKKYIYEGTRDYWKDSLKDPSKYASWVIYNKNQQGDAVADNLQNIENIGEKYNLVYEEKGGFVIYKIKTHPEIEIKN